MNNRSSLNTQSSNDLLTTAELKSKLMNMGKASRIKLGKLAAKFSIKAKNKYNKAMDQTALTCTNLFTSFTPLTNSSDSYYVKNDSNNNTIKKYDTLSSSKELSLIDQFQNYEQEDTYDLEKIKAEEMNSNNSTTNNSRYKKVYRSFKSAIRRNSSASNTSTASSSNGSTPNGYALSNSSSNSSSKLNRYSSSCLPQNDLNVFENDYSYDKSNNNSFSSYDYSVYPYAKIVSSGGSSTKTSTLSKSSKKLLDKLKSQSQSFK